MSDNDCPILIDPLPTSTERLLAVIDIIRDRPRKWDQGAWAYVENDEEGLVELGVSQAIGRGLRCDTVGCIAGWGVMLTPPELLEGTWDWVESGAVALGINEEMADWLFYGSLGQPHTVVILTKLAEMSEADRLRIAPADLF